MLTLLLALAAATTPISYVKEVQVGNWGTIGSLSAKTCATITTFTRADGDETDLMIRRDARHRDSYDMSITNNKWTSKDGVMYTDITYVYGDYAASNSTGKGFSTGDQHGFITRFPTSDIKIMEKSVDLGILKGNVVIANLRLTGMTAAIASLDDCLKTFGPYAYIEDNPFATP